jgi:hypothetical protein
MHSNLITPPDFVKDSLHTVTLINLTENEIELVARMCAASDEMFNIYVYRTEMQDLTWLDRAVEISDAVILNCAVDFEYNFKVSNMEKTHTLDFPTHTQNLNHVLDYFENRSTKK